MDMRIVWSQGFKLPNVRFDFKMCRMNLPPHQAVRGPGSFQAALAMQHIMDHIAAVTGIDPCLVRERNFLRPSSPPPSMGIPAADVSNGKSCSALLCS